MNIAVIPSRIGSQRITEKNLQKVGGKTLLERAIYFALDNGYTPIVSTESEVVKREVNGRCEVLMSNLHGPKGNSLKIWWEAWNHIGLTEHSILLEPTSPMRIQEDLERCVSELKDHWLVRTVEPVKTTNGMRYRFNGSIYAATQNLEFLEDVYDQPHVGSVITGFRVNIDTLDDLRVARVFLGN